MLSAGTGLVADPDGTVEAAIIGGIFLVVAAFIAWILGRVPRERRGKPVEAAVAAAQFSGTAAAGDNAVIAYLLKDNEALHTLVDGNKRDADEKLRIVVQRTQVIGDGFVALSNSVERAKIKLVLLDGEQEKIDAARAAIATDLEWPTAIPNQKDG